MNQTQIIKSEKSAHADSEESELAANPSQRMRLGDKRSVAKRRERGANPEMVHV